MRKRKVVRRKVAAPSLDGGLSFDEIIRRVAIAAVQDQVTELLNRLDEIERRLDNQEDEITDKVNEAMQEFKVDAEQIMGLKEAIAEVLEDATITIGV